jgi:hypothetical protein
MSYEEEVTRIMAQRLPAKLKRSVKCEICGGRRYLLRVNDRFAAYIHHGKALEKCQAVGFRTSYLIDLGKLTAEQMKKNDEAAGKQK